MPIGELHLLSTLRRLNQSCGWSKTKPEGGVQTTHDRQRLEQRERNRTHTNTSARRQRLEQSERESERETSVELWSS